MEANKVDVSVIIPALNEEKYIRHAMLGLRDQSYKKFEVIVVDGGSKDRTREIAKGHAKVIIDTKKGVASARNAGGKIAKGRILLFLDADTRPSKDLIATYYKSFKKDKNIAAATGPILPLEKTRRSYTWGYKFVSIFFVKASILFGRPSFVGSNFAVRKDIFEKTNGFDESMMTYEDWDLSNRLKKHGRMIYINNAVVHTSVRRISEWGMLGYFVYYAGNVFAYHVFRKPHTNYAPIR